jgi:hypothetical protein
MCLDVFFGDFADSMPVDPSRDPWLWKSQLLHRQFLKVDSII